MPTSNYLMNKGIRHCIIWLSLGRSVVPFNMTKNSSYIVSETMQGLLSTGSNYSSFWMFCEEKAE